MQKKWVWTLISVLVAAAGTLAIGIIMYRGGYRQSYLNYQIVLSALAITCAMIGTMWGKAGFLVAIPAFFLLGAASFCTVPLSGYGGQDIAVAFWHSVAFALLAAAGAFFLQRVNDRKVYPVVLLAQVTMLALTISNLNIAYINNIQHWGEKLPVHQLAFTGGVSTPQMEDDIAYVLDGNRNLYRIALETGKKELVAKIPEPTPAEAGHPSLTIMPVYSDFVMGRIISSGEKELTVFYPYFLYRSIDGGHQVAEDYVLEAVVNTETGALTWQLFRQYMDVWSYPGQVVLNEYSLSVGGPRGDSIIVSGIGVETQIWPDGFTRWLVSGKRHFLAGTDNGALYIIEVPEGSQQQGTKKPPDEPEQALTDEWSFSDDYTEVTLNGTTYRNIVFTSRLGQELYFMNMASSYLQDPYYRERYRPDEFFSEVIYEEARNRMNVNFPEGELLTVNNQPWQETEFKDFYLKQALGAIENSYLSEKPDSGQVLAFLADLSNNGYAWNVLIEKLPLESAKRREPLSSRMYNAKAAYLYKTFEEFAYDAGDYSNAIDKDVRRTYDEFLRLMSLPYPVVGEAPVWRLEAVVRPGEPAMIVYEDNTPVNHLFSSNPYKEGVTVWIPASWFTALRFRVDWWEPSHQLSIWQDERSLCTLGTRGLMVDRRLELLPEPVRVSNSEVYVPLQLTARYLGFEVREQEDEIRLIYNKK